VLRYCTVLKSHISYHWNQDVSDKNDKLTDDFDGDRNVDLAAGVFQVQLVLAGVQATSFLDLQFAHVRLLRHAQIVVGRQRHAVLRPLALRLRSACKSMQQSRTFHFLRFLFTKHSISFKKLASLISLIHVLSERNSPTKKHSPVNGISRSTLRPALTVISRGMASRFTTGGR